MFSSFTVPPLLPTAPQVFAAAKELAAQGWRYEMKASVWGGGMVAWGARWVAIVWPVLAGAVPWRL